MNAPLRHALHAVAFGLLALMGWEISRPQPTPAPPATPAGDERARINAHDPARAQDRHSPALGFLSAPRFLTPGQTMRVQGRVFEVSQSSTVHLSLEGPDGTTAHLELRTGDHREAPFSLEHPTPAAAPGSFLWRLRLGPNQPPILLGVDVREPDLPRVLLLQDHPTVEGDRLQRWLAMAGSPVTTRTRVSTDRERVSAANGSPADLQQIDPVALDRFDVVVSHESSLVRLSSTERQILSESIRAHGLGLLIIGAGDPGTPADDAWFSPLRLPSVSSSPVETRLTRVLLTEAMDADSSRDSSNDQDSTVPLSVLAADLDSPLPARVLARDSQGRSLVSVTRLGRGSVARSLVLDSWRWRQRGLPLTYARFWSAIFEAVARPLAPSEGEWSIGTDSTPIVVDEPLPLIWHGAAEGPLPGAAVRRIESGTTNDIPLNLARVAHEPAQARSLFWPADPGWHEVQVLPNGPGRTFYVQSTDAMAAVLEGQRRDRAAWPWKELSPATSKPGAASETVGSRRPTMAIWFVLFVLAAAALWARAYSAEAASRTAN